ncbi:MAG: hypothetical protein ACO3A2_09045 [Bdellovibrionia bacterium]
MRKQKSGVLGVLGMIASVISLSAHAGMGMEEFNQLTLAEKQMVEDGGQVAHFGNEKPWPFVVIFQKINSTPEEAAAVFSDYANHVNFIPNMIKSAPTPVSKTVSNVYYQAKLPFLPAWVGGVESYLVRDEVMAYDDFQSFQVSWSLIPGHGETVKSSEGRARFESMGNATLLVYNSAIVPNRFGVDVGFVVEGAKDTMRKGVEAIVRRVETLKAENNPLLKTEIENLRKSFSFE